MINIRKHSDYHIETKAVYPLSSKKKTKRDIHYYIYSPAQLYMNDGILSKNELINMVTTYGRFGSPLLSFKEILDRDNKQSHLYNVIDEVKKDEINERYAISELQLLANAIRHESKSHTKSVEIYLKKRNFNGIKSAVNEYIDNLTLILMEYRTIIENNKISNENVLDALIWTDEHLSLVSQKEANAIYKLLYKKENEYIDARNRIEKFGERESEYRINKHYATGINEDNSTAEKASYRASMLKKWTQSVLYLTPVESNSPKHAGQIMAGIAAAIAMTFATLASIYAEKVFSKNSYQWALIIIIAYVFKDRIKEGLRAILNKVLPKFLADSIYRFVKPNDEKKICKTKVKVDINKARYQESEIKRIRELDKNPFRSMLPDEDVIHYSRYVSISKQSFKRDLCSDTFTLINRIRLDEYIKEMDNTSPLRKVADPDDLVLNRVYHLHLIVREQNEKEKIDEIQHYLIVMNKDGIIRLEKLF